MFKCSLFVSVSRQDLVSWLQQQIAEQQRVDASTSGATIHHDILHAPLPVGASAGDDVQLVLPVDTKRQRKLKQILLDKGEATSRLLNTTDGGHYSV